MPIHSRPFYVCLQYFPVIQAEALYFRFGSFADIQQREFSTVINPWWRRSATGQEEPFAENQAASALGCSSLPLAYLDLKSGAAHHPESSRSVRVVE
jgi:hypothetical protein